MCASWKSSTARQLKAGAAAQRRGARQGPAAGGLAGAASSGEPGRRSPQAPPPRLIGPGREDELQAQQETLIGAAHEVQTKRRHPEGGSIYCLGFLPPG